MILAIVLGPLIWPVPINEIDFSASLQGPSLAHPLGTDDLGQDLLARMLYGGRISLAVGLAAMAVAVLVGVVIGAVAGMSRGWLDTFLMWLTDLFLCLPALPLLLLIIYLFRDRLTAIFGPEGGVFIPSTRDYKLGDDVYVLLSLPDDPQRYPVAGKVAWVTPAKAAGNRAQGVGIQFPKDEKTRLLKQKIEEILGASLASDRPTQTI